MHPQDPCLLHHGAGRQLRLLATAALLCVSASGATSVLAQTPAPVVEEDMRKEVLAKEKKGKPNGLTKSLAIGSTAAFNHASNVVGSPDGAMVQVGILLDGRTEFVVNQFEWSNVLKIQHTQTRTPQVPVFVKSADMADLTSTAIWRTKALDWFGPYAKFRAQVQVFSGYAVDGTDRTVKKLDVDGKEYSSFDAKRLSTINLTSPFEPLVMSETIGAFANPFERKKFTLKAKLGAGSQQVIADNGFAVADNKDTPELEIKEIRQAVQVGAEGELAINGEASAQVSWRAKASIFVPALSTVEGSKAGMQASSTDLTAGASVKLAKWLSVDYIITARRVPLIINEWQIQNGLMLTAGFKL